MGDGGADAPGSLVDAALVDAALVDGSSPSEGGGPDSIDTDAAKADAAKADGPSQDVGRVYTMTALKSMPPNWQAPRLFDGAYASAFTRSAQRWNRKSIVIVPPGKRIVIGPRYLGTDATKAPAPTKGMGLSLDGNAVDLKLHSMLPAEKYLFGTKTEQYFKRTSGQVLSFGIAIDTLNSGIINLRATSLVELSGAAIPWVDDVQIKVRPYLRNTFAGKPPAGLSQVKGLWVIPAAATVIRNVTVIKGDGAAPIQSALVAISGEWIVGVGKATAFDLSAAPTIIDGKGGYLIPGLFNAHVHYVSDMQKPAVDWLKQGVTSMIDVGGRLLEVFSVREAFAESKTPQPDLLVAGPIIEAPEAGHAKTFGTPGFYGVTTVAQATAAATTVADWGANLIKICTDCKSPSGTSMTVNQVKAIVAVARSRKLKVMAHTTSDKGIADALAGGVDSLTHTPTLSDTRIQEMKKAGVILIPTISATYRSLTAMLNDVARAHIAGVPMATGNDFPARARGLPILEMQYLERAGLTRMQVLQATTQLAAKVAGVDGVVGTVMWGKIADLVVLGSNPLSNINNYKSVRMVFKRGVQVALP